MKFILQPAAVLLLACLPAIAAAASDSPLRVGIVGLVHGHAAGFLSGSALVPAGGAVHRPDVQVVGVVEPDSALFDNYAKRYGWPQSMHFTTIDDLVSHAHPQAALIFTSTAGHTDAVKKCASLGVHVMMEKPMAVSYADALAMADAAKKGHIHVLVDYETTWYASNAAAYGLLQASKLGALTKAVFRDGHEGPKKIHVQPEFFQWLTDPKENGAGALYDFGCYGADLLTWMLHGEAPVAVSAVAKHLQPDVYPHVDDEADVVLDYKNAVGILEGSWTWPFAVKDGDIYGISGYVKTIGPNKIDVRHGEQKSADTQTPQAPSAPYDDPLHYLAAVIRGEIQEGNDPSSLQTNLIVSEILDAARQSAQSGRKVTLPLTQ